MSNETNETIADIVAWLRRPIEGENAYLTLWRDEIADRIVSAAKREREAGAEAAFKQSVTNCNHLGNAAKIREALENIAEYAKAATCHTEDAHLLGYLKQIERWAEAALSKPPRNCDVGTAHEQEMRLEEFCDSHECNIDCPLSNYNCSQLSWAQMPYEEGGTK